MRLFSREMACQELVELVTAYLDGSLSRRDRRRFDAHIRGCEHCTAYVEQMRLLIAATGRLTEEDIPSEAREDLLAAFRGWSEGRPASSDSGTSRLSSRCRYCSRLRTLRNSSITRWRAALPNFGRPRWIGDEGVHSSGHRLEVRGIVDQDTRDAVLDLILDPAHSARDQWARLPHRLRDGEPEALGQALLHDYVGAPLDRVHHRRVLLDVVHRQRREMHAAPASRQAAPDRAGVDLGEHLGPFGIVRDARHRRAGEDQVGVVGLAVFGEAAEHADRILEPIPA